ncbi:MAG: hypothetical protein ACK5M3_12125 [Dysgonomonas sp.]
MKERLERTIADIAINLAQTKDDFFIIGASALVLSGIDIENTEDIDILTSKRDALILQELWEDKTVSNHIAKHSNLFRSNFNRYRFQWMDVEVMGGLEINIDGKWTLLTINDYIIHNVGNIEIKIPTLQEQRRIFALFGREKDNQRLKLIDDYLSRY